MAKDKKAPGTDAKTRAHALEVWVAVGTGVGTALGVIFGQIGLGVALGAGVGIVIGSVLASRGDGRRADRQDPDA